MTLRSYRGLAACAAFMLGTAFLQGCDGVEETQAEKVQPANAAVADASTIERQLTSASEDATVGSVSLILPTDAFDTVRLIIYSQSDTSYQQAEDKFTSVDEQTVPFEAGESIVLDGISLGPVMISVELMRDGIAIESGWAKAEIVSDATAIAVVNVAPVSTLLSVEIERYSDDQPVTSAAGESGDQAHL